MKCAINGKPGRKAKFSRDQVIILPLGGPQSLAFVSSSSVKMKLWLFNVFTFLTLATWVPDIYLTPSLPFTDKFVPKSYEEETGLVLFCPSFFD